MVKIDFDVESLVGDLLSPDGFFIDLVACEQFTFWYLLRQLGIRSYAPIIGTNSFLLKESKSSPQELIRMSKQNLFLLFEGASKYFNTKIISYDNSYKSYHHFIKEVILKERFVYILYDTSFDSEKIFRLDYRDWHGCALVGFDDDREEYISIFSTSIKYRDLENMIQKGYQRDNTYKNILYYIDSAESPPASQILPEINRDLIEDIKKDMEQWKIEFQFFQKEIEEIRKSKFLNMEEQCAFIEERNLFFNILMVGGYGDFIFKIRYMQELYKIDMKELEERFSKNRKESLVIANMFRKALIKLKRNQQEYYISLLPAICDKVNNTFIKEGMALYKQFYRKICFLW